MATFSISDIAIKGISCCVPKNKEINIATYETLRMFLEIVLTYHDESDDTLGADRALLGTPLSFKIAFNTLLKHGIIKELL